MTTPKTEKLKKFLALAETGEVSGGAFAKEILVASAIVIQNPEPDRKEMEIVLRCLRGLPLHEQKEWEGCTDDAGAFIAGRISELLDLFHTELDFEALAKNRPGLSRKDDPEWAEFISLHRQGFERYCSKAIELADAAGIELEARCKEPGLFPIPRLHLILESLSR